MRCRLALASLTLIVLVAAGCNRQKVRRIAVIPKGMADVFFQSVHAGAVAAGREFHEEILWDGPPRETDYSRQLAILDSMLNRHVDGIVVAAADRTSLNATLERAAREKVPVVVFDSGVDSTNINSFVATNNHEAGEMGGRKLAQLIGGKGKVAVVDHAPGSASTMDREQGFKDVIAKEFPGIQVVAEQYSMTDRARGLAATENILSAHPDLSGIFTSAEPASAGAAEALKSRGLTGKVHLVAFDSSDDLVENLKGGAIDALIAQDPFRMGFEGVRVMTDILDGKTPAKKIDMHAVVVTKADLDKPEIHALIYPDLKKYLGN